MAKKRVKPKAPAAPANPPGTPTQSPPMTIPEPSPEGSGVVVVESKENAFDLHDGEIDGIPWETPDENEEVIRKVVMAHGTTEAKRSDPIMRGKPKMSLGDTYACMLPHVCGLRGRLESSVAIVVGGGHSAKPFYQELSFKKSTFGCSGVPLVCKVGYWYSCDVVRTKPMLEWLTTDKDTIKVLAMEAWKDEKVAFEAYQTQTPPPGPISDPWKNGLWHGCSSAIGAAELARLAGARKIYLMGVDYTDVTHPFDEVDPQRGMNRKPWNEDRVLAHWRIMRDEFRSQRVEVICANPKSLLVLARLFPSCDPNDALNACP